MSEREQEKSGRKVIMHFASINFPYQAVIQDGMLVRYITEMPYTGPVRFYYEMKNSVYVLKLIPGMQPDILPYLFERYDCLVVEKFRRGRNPGVTAG